MALVMLGYVRYDPYQVDGDAVSYMDLASAILHGRWHEIVNGLWNPAYPALLADGKLIAHADRMHELQVFYWVNYVIFLGSIACTAFFVRSLLILRGNEKNEQKWMLSDKLLYLAAYSIVFLSWQYEFSLGKIRVDGLFAACLLLAFGSLLRMVHSNGLGPAIGAGVSFGLAYLVKSPGFVVAMTAFALFLVYLYFQSKLKLERWRLLAWIVAFLVVAGPYMAALSLQKGRIDVGDSGRLNYAWYVSGTAPLHLLNDQPARFGHADVQLRHSQIELASNPGIVSFVHFPNATYGPWFDPSYYNEGVIPRFSLRLQLKLILDQSREVVYFLEVHSLILALLVFSGMAGAHLARERSLRHFLILLYVMLAFCFVMYVCVQFLDRYVGGVFWIASIATLGLLILRNDLRRGMTEGATIFMGIAFLLLGAQSVGQMRQFAVFHGQSHGWENKEEFAAARSLRAAGILAGSSVACFRACNTGSYWARLSNVHITSEIFDPRYIADVGDGAEMWESLPNKPLVLSTLRKAGARAIIGYFEQAPGSGEGWHHLAGHYYLMPL